MRLIVAEEKLTKIIILTREYVDVTRRQIEDFIDGGDEGWETGDEDHQAWLDTADADEIAAWIIAGLR